MTPAAPAKRLVVLYGIGGLSDVGRHAILAALEQTSHKLEKITVIIRKILSCWIFPIGNVLVQVVTKTRPRHIQIKLRLCLLNLGS